MEHILQKDLDKITDPTQEQIKLLEENIKQLRQIKTDESEEHQKNIVNRFLQSTFSYDNINTKDKADAVISDENNNVRVIIEYKRVNSAEFPKDETLYPTLSSKALAETMLYFMRAIKDNQNNINHIILATAHTLYIIDARDFEKISNDKNIKKLFSDVGSNESTNPRTQHFYDKFLEFYDTIQEKLHYFKLDMTDPSKENLVYIYKCLCPEHLFKMTSYTDANVLNKHFYEELLYILGLQEKMAEGKVQILPSDTPNTLLDTMCANFNLDRKNDFESIFALLMIWNNRILFIRLLESMLLSCSHIDERFFTTSHTKDFKDMSKLFFDVLAKHPKNRQHVEGIYEKIPYLNSSLFEKSVLENDKDIKSLDSHPLKIKDNSILKNTQSDSLPLLEYLLSFLQSYMFTTTTNDIQDGINASVSNLINASVLGLVFEKLNGYKDGSFYTPSFITSYMCKASIEKVVIDRFNTELNIHAQSIEDIYNNIKDTKKANDIFDTITICDPAVGSGHFLVSALNEMIRIKFDLGLLYDDDGKRLKDIDLKLQNDEIMILNSDNKPHKYTYPKNEKAESHKIQKTLFSHKRQIIENSLFGVDINPNSCEITKLRLWIELLKHSYYKDIATRELETLPNIDINIKCGNSLASKIDIRKTKDTIKKDIKAELNKNSSLESENELKEVSNFIKNNFDSVIDKYKQAVKEYKNALDKDLKKISESNIANSKKQLLKLFIHTSKIYLDFKNELREYFVAYGYYGVDTDKITNQEHKEKLNKYIIEFKFNRNTTNYNKETTAILQKDISNVISKMLQYEKLLYEDTFEWRFEFPEVLDDNGDFKGFDLIIGNPPYINQRKIKDLTPIFKSYKVYNGMSDIYAYFYELGYTLLKDSAILSYITSNTWCRNKFGINLRKYLLDKTTILEYIDFNDVKVFDSATVDTSILSFQKRQNQSYTFKYIKMKDKDIDKKDFVDIDISTLSEEVFLFLDENIAKLNSKIESKGVPLKNWDIFIHLGITTGCNEVFIIDTDTKDNILASCKDQAERERTKDIFKPMLRGRDIDRYNSEWKELWMVFIPWHFPNTSNPKSMDKNEQDLSILFPSIYKYLIKHKNILNKRSKSEVGVRYEWYCMQRWGANYYQEFEKEKIIYPETTQGANFVYDNKGMFLDKSSFFITLNTNRKDTKKLFYLNGLLSSSLLTYYYKNNTQGCILGEKGYQYNKHALENLPIPQIDSTNQKIADEIVKNVEMILESKRQDIPTQELEDKIDDLVYELYDLAPDEIQMLKDS